MAETETTPSATLTRSPYEILEVDRRSTDEEIKASYFVLVKKYSPEYHPDEFIEVRTAYDLLKEPASKARVDVGILAPSPRLRYSDYTDYPEQPLSHFKLNQQLSAILADRSLEQLTEEEKKRILALRNDPDLEKKILASIAPTVHGHEVIKKALAAALFGGVPKKLPDGTRIRGDIHVLLVGDPGTAKSHLLKCVADTRHRPHQTGLYCVDGVIADVEDKAKKTTIVADVHTEANTRQVLEEGVGYVDLIVVAYKLPDGRILIGAGPVMSYYEFKQPMSDRLTDDAWRELLSTNPPDRPEWVSNRISKP